MKAKGIKSVVEINGPVMTYKLVDVASGKSESITIALDAIFSGWNEFSELTRRALGFSTRTRLRNETAGAEFAEAVSNIKEAISDFLAGTWSAARATSGEPRSGLLVQAIVIASKGKYDATSAQALISGLVKKTADAQGVDIEAEDEESLSALRKIRAAVRKAFLEQKPSVAAALAQLQADAAAKKAASAADAAESSNDFE